MQSFWKTGTKPQYEETFCKRFGRQERRTNYDGLEDRLRWGRQAGEEVASHTKYNEPQRRISGALKVAATYSPTTCSTIGVAELGVGVWCSVARRAPSAAAAPRRLGCSDDYKRAHYETGLERGRTRQAFVSRHAHMDGGNGSIHVAGRTIHVSQARQQSVSAGETEDGTGGMAETGRMAQLISGRVIHYYYACGCAGGGAHRRRHARARRVARTIRARHGLV